MELNSSDDHVSLTKDEIDIAALTKLCGDDTAGAISSFLGVTRNTFNDKIVLHLEYEAYESMALDALQDLCHKARSQWDLKKVVIQHKLGACPVGERGRLGP